MEDEVKALESSLVKQDGSVIFVRENARALRTGNGKVLGYAGSLEEITEKRRAADAFAEEKERLSATLHSIGEGVIATDTEGNIVSMNKAAEELTGWNQEETMGEPLDKVFLIVNNKTRELSPCPVDQAIRAHGAVGLMKDTILITRNGEEKFVSATSSPIRDKHGSVTGVVLTFRDITERKLMEDELLKAQKLESVGVLAGGIANDFNNSLTGILGNVSLSKTYVSPASKIYKRLLEAEKECLRAAELTKQLLTFSETGAPFKKVTSLKELMKDSTEFALRGSTVRSEFSMGNIWLVEVDEIQVRQVIYTLMANARQEVSGDRVIRVKAENVSIKNKPPLKSGNYVKVAIEYEGTTISEEHLHKIFDPYFTTEQTKGGLGLATSYSIIRSNDGHIEVAYKPGAGTSFNIYLPALGEVIHLEDELRGNEDEESFAIDKGKVLVMDDDETVREVAADILRQTGYEVASAKDGTEAIKLYKKAIEKAEPFDVVIMDLSVPGGMGAKEAISELLVIDPDVKAILSSGYLSDPLITSFKEYGFKGVITKPYGIEELCKIVFESISDETDGFDISIPYFSLRPK